MKTNHCNDFFLAGTLLVEMPMADFENRWKDNGDDELVPTDTWHWWNAFRSYSDYNSRYHLALELTTDLPSPDVILRWMGESIETLIIPIDLFILNRNNYPVLPYAHRIVTQKFLAMTNCKLALKAPADDNAIIENHIVFLRYLYKENVKRNDPMVGYAKFNYFLIYFTFFF